MTSDEQPLTTAQKIAIAKATGTMLVEACPVVQPDFCIVMLDGDPIYIGQLSPRVYRYLEPGVRLFLHPDDFADYAAFTDRKKQ